MITLAGSWEQVGIKLIGQVESSPLQYVPVQHCCYVIHNRVTHWLVPATKDDLDSDPLLRGRPILLSRIDYHAYWVSNTILSSLKNLPDVVYGGLIIRDEAGKPTGPSGPSPMTLARISPRLFPN